MAEISGPHVYSCSNCRNQMCLHDDIISKAFQVNIFYCFVVCVADFLFGYLDFLYVQSTNLVELFCISLNCPHYFRLIMCKLKS
jgi:hypothetical protein